MGQHDGDRATIEAVFALASDVSRPIIQQAHMLLLGLHPDAFVTAHLGHRSISYGIGPKMMSESYCYVMPFAQHVNLGFYRGTTIDADGVLEGSGLSMRHLKLRSSAELASPRTTDLVLLAIAERRGS